MRNCLATAALVAGLSLSGCATNGLYSGVSVGYGSGYGPYGNYGSRYGYGYGYNRWNDPWYDPFYRTSYYGWYGNYYYPGSGFYVYDRYRRPVIWSDSQRRYWTDRRQRYVTTVRERPAVTQNWSGFTRDRATTRRIAPRSEIQRVRTIRATRATPRSEIRSERPRASRATLRARQNRQDD